MREAEISGMRQIDTNLAPDASRRWATHFYYLERKIGFIVYGVSATTGCMVTRPFPMTAWRIGPPYV